MKLASLVDVEPRTISAYENGEFPPSTETLSSIASKLRFPVEFFFGPDLDVPNTRAVSFRALSRMTAGERDAALGAGAVALLLNEWIERKFDLPPPRIPDMQGEEPESAAETLRAQWGLGDRPIRNLVHLLEANGVRVFSLAEDTRRVDAYSFWRSDTPVVFLNTAKSAERSRFDAAHELGHLLLHKHGGPHGAAGQGVEDQANAFASAFLMPSSSVLATIRSTPTIGQLVQYKKKWTVSVVALLYRLWKLRILSDWQYRAVCVQVGDFRTNEPDPATRETSQVMMKIFDSLRADGISKVDVARELSVLPSHIEELTFGLCVSEGNSAATRPRSKQNRSHLRVVK